VLLVVGTRPNFMKIAPVAAELAARPERFESALVHTGQHYDAAMSQVFLEELGIGEPDRTLGVGSGTHTEQTAGVLEGIDRLLGELRPDLVLVAGDVNSSMAAAVAAAQKGVPVGHIEAGLRSFDRTMPEELNRVLADAVSDLLFIHSPEARDHLLAEGRPAEAIHDVGNTMIDTLVALRPRIEALGAPSLHGLEPGGYLLVTLHRPALVDGPQLRPAIDALELVARELTVVFPVHPRTRKAMAAQGLGARAGVRLLEPLGYLEFLGLLTGAAGALTDSGGIQEEATFLGVPCFTLRDNTERPITVELGTNTLLGLRPERIEEIPALMAAVNERRSSVPPLWDGQAARRIVDVIEQQAVGRPGG
jgi:UDP-N-acetylglucosamine 2-epimerase (non-hydrolysing)